MPAGAFTGGRALALSDTILAAGTATQDFKTLADGKEIRPQATWVNSSSDTDEQAVREATIVGYLFGENETDEQTYVVKTGVAIPLAFRAINANGTTARGIKLISEM